MGSEQHRFPPPQQPLQPPPPPPPPRTFGHKRWVGCWGGLSCFGRQKGGKRIVPASRMPEANSLANQPNGPQVGGVNNQTTGLPPHLLAPPSSPASFSTSALPSTAQSPSCFLSANSPGGPSSTMYATGPYAHETQLVSPPVFSTFTTEPSTAPFTPPPELAHLTTPSSPDVPYARFLSSSVGIKGTDKTNFVVASDLHSAYSLYPESPASNFRSPSSRTTGDCLPSPLNERELPQYDPSVASQELKTPESDSGGLYGLERAGNSKLSHDSNFFCPATFAQFYDHSFPLSGGRLSVSKESDAHSNAGNGHQNWQNKNCKQDAEEIEAYRASFGFSADEIVTTAQYVEITDVLDDSFSMTPFTSNKSQEQENIQIVSADKRTKAEKANKNMLSPQYCKSGSNHVAGVPDSNKTDNCSKKNPGDAFGASALDCPGVSDDEDIFSKMGNSRVRRNYHLGLSSSDAEVEYRRGRSWREGKGSGAWRG
ncbi:uncharacterized protein At1g76660-like isoform X2 [Ipomoea triloba]|uniref:uncharacterized protein At1g76660-like isoform X2 n=1 Tax=Ipomoea triloba TaxID=35885 RepID=UPI00125DAB55|nr:uncharacterized protein At1g76660-like isoform X2 [Ipomoea triloba]